MLCKVMMHSLREDVRNVNKAMARTPEIMALLESRARCDISLLLVVALASLLLGCGGTLCGIQEFSSRFTYVTSFHFADLFDALYFSLVDLTVGTLVAAPAACAWVFFRRAISVESARLKLAVSTLLKSQPTVEPSEGVREEG